MIYMYRVQCEGRTMRQLDIPSDVVLSEKDVVEKALELFHDECGDGFTEVEVSDSELLINRAIGLGYDNKIR